MLIYAAGVALQPSLHMVNLLLQRVKPIREPTAARPNTTVTAKFVASSLIGDISQAVNRRSDQRRRGYPACMHRHGRTVGVC